VGFDFAIGLPHAYAAKCGFGSFREALDVLGEGEYAHFFKVSDTPSLQQPFYPPPTSERGKYKKESLATGLGIDLPGLLRRCDRKRLGRDVAECLFFTLGGKQVGRSVISGWLDVIKPARGKVCLWPFDGPYEALLLQDKEIVAEIYPAEAYGHLGFRMGAGTGLRKGSRDDRKKVSQYLLDAQSPAVQITDAARSWIEWGFRSEDDFDATAALLSMLLVVTGERRADVPNDERVRKIEGWIFGQEPTGLGAERDSREIP